MSEPVNHPPGSLHGKQVWFKTFRDGKRHDGHVVRDEPQDHYISVQCTDGKLRRHLRSLVHRVIR